MKHLFVLLVILPFVGVSQKIAVDKIDEFENVRIIQTSPAFLGNISLATQSAAQIKNGDTAIAIHFSVTVNTFTRTDKSSKVSFKLVNDEIIELPVINEDVAGTGAGLNVFVAPNKEIVNKLTTFNIKLMRFNTKERNIDWALPTKSQATILKQLNVLMQRVKGK